MPSGKSFYIFILLIFFPGVIAQAAQDRDLIIQKAMDCVDKHLQQNAGISWNDVCDITDSSAQDQMQVANQQMNQVEGNAMPLSGSAQNLVPQNLPQAFVPDTQSRPAMLLDIAPELSYIRTNEPSTGIKKSGMMSGINGIFTYRPPEGNALNSAITNMYRIEGLFSYGKLDYKDPLATGNYPGNVIPPPSNFNGLSDYMAEARGLIGRDFFFNSESSSLTPYFGIGYRQLFSALYADHPYGFDNRTQYVYIPTGIDAMTKLNDGWSLGANAEYDFLVNGNVQSYYGNIGYGNLENTQKHGYGVRGSIKLIKSWNRFNFILEPYVRYWHVHNSKYQMGDPFPFNGQEYVVVGIVPDNDSLEMGGKLGVEF